MTVCVLYCFSSLSHFQFFTFIMNLNLPIVHARLYPLRSGHWPLFEHKKNKRPKRTTIN